MRGTLVEIMVDLRCDGIIPAYAGNTMCATPALPSTRDHPRVCGEHVKRVHRHRHAIRIIPAYAGNTHSIDLDRRAQWIIPAYAGNTCGRRARTYPTRDHPRVCGEHNAKTNYQKAKEGSSPRMRGTQLFAEVGQLRLGIIPAYAGNTLPWRGPQPIARDHPRVCGEHTKRLA